MLDWHGWEAVGALFISAAWHFGCQRRFVAAATADFLEIVQRESMEDIFCRFLAPRINQRRCFGVDSVQTPAGADGCA